MGPVLVLAGLVLVGPVFVLVLAGLVLVLVALILVLVLVLVGPVLVNITESTVQEYKPGADERGSITDLCNRRLNTESCSMGIDFLSLY